MTLSYWSATCLLPDFPSLTSNLKDDIVVVGGGIGGLTTAYLLLKEGRSVTLITDRAIVSGETCRTTGHLTCMLDTRIFELEKRFKKNEILKSLKSHAEAIDQIEKICSDEKIDCNFERIDGHLFQESEFTIDLLQKEFEALQRVGFDKIRLEKSPFPFFHSEKMLTFPNQAQFHPLKYAAALSHAIYKLKGKIYTDTQVIKIQGGNNCKLLTKDNFQIIANKLIIATNTPINNRFVIHTKQAPYRTYVCAAKIPKKSIPKNLYYDTLDPYHYVRITEEAQNDILIIGGEDHKTGQENHCKERFHRVQAWAQQRFAISEFTYFWSGQILEPIDSLGLIGKNPLEENIYIITGHSGNGLTYGTLGGMIIRDLILKKTSEYETLYFPGRITWTAAYEFLKENLNVGKQYTSWLRPSFDNNLNDLPNDSGKVINKKNRKIAIYRDTEGNLYEMSAACPHLGCIVNWNDAEKTWDCPCHGSRFTCKGNVINGPSTYDLSKSVLQE